MLTPSDVRNRTFKQRWWSGYDMDEVEAFLKEAADELEAAVEENEDLHARLKRAEGEVGEVRNKRRLLEDALVSAQRVIDDMKDNAKREAEIILKDAELQADKWITSANTQIAELKREINELKRLRKEYELKFRSLLESHLALLEMAGAPEKRPRRDSGSGTVAAPPGEVHA